MYQLPANFLACHTFAWHPHITAHSHQECGAIAPSITLLPITHLVNGCMPHCWKPACCSQMMPAGPCFCSSHLQRYGATRPCNTTQEARLAYSSSDIKCWSLVVMQSEAEMNTCTSLGRASRSATLTVGIQRGPRRTHGSFPAFFARMLLVSAYTGGLSGGQIKTPQTTALPHSEPPPRCRVAK